MTAREEACAKLRKWIKPGSTIYTVLRHRSASGMTRSIDLLQIIPRDEYSKRPSLRQLSSLAAQAMGDRPIDCKHGGIKVGGCGMDMGFSLVYELGRALWPNGTRKPHGTRNGSPDTDGGYAIKHQWI